MSDPLSFAQVANEAARPGAHVFAARINRSSGWALCVVVGDSFFHSSPTMTETQARGSVQALREPVGGR